MKNHPSVRIANSRLALEQIIVAADQNNIDVLLDIHSCSNYVDWRKGRLDARPPYVDATRDNYDFKRENYSCAATNNPASVTSIQAYNETLWLNDLRTLAGLGQQLGVDNIIGIDIFNEPWDYTWPEWKTLSEARLPGDQRGEPQHPDLRPGHLGHGRQPGRHAEHHHPVAAR